MLCLNRTFLVHGPRLNRRLIWLSNAGHLTRFPHTTVQSILFPELMEEQYVLRMQERSFWVWMILSKCSHVRLTSIHLTNGLISHGHSYTLCMMVIPRNRCFQGPCRSGRNQFPESSNAQECGLLLVQLRISTTNICQRPHCMATSRNRCSQGPCRSGRSQLVIVLNSGKAQIQECGLLLVPFHEILIPCRLCKILGHNQPAFSCTFMDRQGRPFTVPSHGHQEREGFKKSRLCSIVNVLMW